MAIAAVGLAFGVVAVLLLTACAEEEEVQTVAATPTVEEVVSPEPEPIDTSSPPTATAVPPTATVVPAPVVLEGFGQTATDPITPPSAISRLIFTHNGSSNFIVQSFQGGEEDYVINEIGAYHGSRPLFGDEPIVFDIDADGAWTLRVEPIGMAASSAFAGRGDAVSDMFSPPPDPSPWVIRHTGQRNFVVWVHCAGGSDLIQNEIGPVDASTIVQFEDGPCLWEVEADGEWSLAPH